MSETSKVAVVTGAASGIGRATAVRLLNAGWCVASVDLAPPNAAGDHGQAFLPIGADISDPDAVAAIVEATLDRYGHLDAVANVAGISLPSDTRVEDVDLETFDRTIAVNLRGTFLMCRAAIAALRANGGGSIVNVGSVASIRGTGGPAYISSKSGIAGLTRAIAAQYACEHIRCNTVAPGPTSTPMLEISKKKSSSTAMGLPGTLPGEASADEIAALIEFLLSEEARFMTGSIVAIDGGITQH